MKVYLIQRSCGDGCSYYYENAHSIWTDEYKMLAALETLNKLLPADHYGEWIFTEVETDPEHLDEECL